MEFNFNQSRINRLRKKLSQLDGNNVKQYPEYSKYMKELINLADNEELYVNKISGLKKFYLLHLAKLYFYWDYDESKGLNNPEWTKEHWILEIVRIFSFTDRLDFYNEYKELPLNINKVAKNSNYIRLLRDTLKSKLELNNNKDVIDKLTKGDKDDIHELPPIDLNRLTFEWKKFLDFYLAFTEKVLARIGYSCNTLSYEAILDFITRVIKKKYNSSSEIILNTKDIKFSELAVEDMIEMFRNY